MNKIVSRIKEEFSNTPDLIIKDISLSVFNKVHVVYIETLCSSDKVSNYILKNITLLSSLKHKSIAKINNIVAGSNTKFINNLDEIEYYLTNGFSIVINNNKALAIETKGDLTRSISEPTSEPSILGPKDAFVENYQTNIGLIKRRIKSKNLKIESTKIGRLSNNSCGILYIDDIADTNIVKELKRRLDNIDIDAINDSGILAQFIESETNSVFPTVKLTERPDVVSISLCEGKIAIVLENSNFVIIVPAFFIDFINPIEDKYNKNVNVNFLKVARLICFFISISIPAFYVAVITYNQETVPTSLLMSFSAQRNGVPFPAVIEALLMLTIYEILRESDIRFPSNTGSSISILGALILGEATVSAGIVSPIMIIVIALTFISSLVFSQTEIINAMRLYRFIFLVMAALFGLLGIVYALFFFLINITSIKTINVPYLSPIVPFDKSYFKKTVLRSSNKNDSKRSKILTDKNMAKERLN